MGRVSRRQVPRLWPRNYNEMWPIRQIGIYDAGPVLRYGPERIEDAYGCLGETALGERDERSKWEISATEFERDLDGTRSRRGPVRCLLSARFAAVEGV